MSPRKTKALFMIAIGFFLLSVPRLVNVEAIVVGGAFETHTLRAIIYGVSGVGGLSCIAIGIVRLVRKEPP